MKDWKLEKGILFSKGKERRSCTATVRVTDAVLGLLEKEKGNYGCKGGVYGAVCAAVTVSWCSGWTQRTSLNKMIVCKWCRERVECSCFKEEWYRQFLYVV